MTIKCMKPICLAIIVALAQYILGEEAQRPSKNSNNHEEDIRRDFILYAILWRHKFL
jgi:hypothetical protein